MTSQGFTRLNIPKYLIIYLCKHFKNDALQNFQETNQKYKKSPRILDEQ